MFDIVISGTGSCIPPHVITNEDLLRAMGDKDKKWSEGLGITERHSTAPLDFGTGRIQSPDFDELEMARQAAMKALTDANLIPNDISLLIYATCTQREDRLHFSQTAIALQHALGLPIDMLVLEFDTGCSGAVHAIVTAFEILQGGKRKNALIVASNDPFQFFDVNLYAKAGNSRSGFIFGSGAGAVVLSKKKHEKNFFDRGIIATYCGSSAESSIMKYGVVNDSPKPVYVIKSRDVLRFFPPYMHRSIEKLKEERTFLFEDIARFYIHQPDKNLFMRFLKDEEIPQEKTSIRVHKYGNLSAATLLVLLDEDRKAGLIHENDLCLFVAMGAGMQFGAFLVRL